MLNKLEKDNIIFAAITLADGKNKNFTDLELAQKLGVARDVLTDFLKSNAIIELRQTRKTEFKCECGKGEVDIFEGMNVAFCNNCNHQYNEIPYWSFGINDKEAVEFLKTKAIGLFIGCKLLSAEENKIQINYNNAQIALLLSIANVGLDDIYLLKGWASEGNPDFLLATGLRSSFTLSAQYSKGLLGVLTIEKLFNPTLFEIELKNIKKSIAERKKELSLKWKYKESQDWCEIEKYWTNIISETEILSVQGGTESPKTQGEKFQAHIIDLLRITIFNAKYLGGKNLPDGTIFLRSTGEGKSELIPLEIKSKKKGFVYLQKHEAQIRKYLSAFKNTYVTDTYRISRLVVLGHDFKIDNPKENEVKRKLENDFDIKIILFPLKSLVHLVNLYFKYKISYIDNDSILRFLEIGYIENKNVDSLMHDLKEITIHKDEDTYNKVQRTLESTGY